ncbi:MAG: penicillin-binding protein 2 [Acidimicrobiales bacterium]
MNPDTLRFRMTAVGVVVVCLFGALFARLWYLQVLDSSQFQVAAQQNGVRLIYEPAPRGRILDRKGRVIVDNKIINILTVDRLLVKKHPEVTGRLAALLGRSPQDIKLAIADPRFSDLAPVPLGEASPSVITYVAEHAEDFSGAVQVTQEAVRTYPNGSLAAHLLGYVGEINDTELAAHSRDGYRLGDQIGKSGVELAYEGALRGRPGATKLEVDVRGRVIGTLDRQSPVQGHDLRLSVDLDIQNLAEDSLKTGLAVAQTQFDRSVGHNYAAPAGAVVVEDPHDGSILALASWPTYDPSAFVNGISTSLFATLNDPAGHSPLTDRATSGLYAPGSTFKLVTATAALDKGLITPGTPFYDRGFVQVGGQRFNNAGNTSYGTVALPQAIAVSSDSFFYDLGRRFWEGGHSLAIQDTAHAYGFGTKTGIAIGGEQAGRVPDPALRKRLHDANPAAFPNGQWFTGDNVNLAIGQGDLVVTPLQLANAYATFANGGTLYEPRVAMDIENQDGSKIADVNARPGHQVTMSAEDRGAVLDGFKGVVASNGGTAHQAFSGFPNDTFTVAGKTGTAQVGGKEDTSVFTCFAPADNPAYAVTVFEEEAGFGASGAAPVARRILEGIAGRQPPPPTYIPSQEAAVN